jgi:hypothetical protein
MTGIAFEIWSMHGSTVLIGWSNFDAVGTPAGGAAEVTRANSSDPTPDGKGVSSSIPQVRQQAASTGNGRFYHIGFTATDVNKASCSCTVKVSVKPKSSSATPKDGGALYDATK